MLCKQGHFLRNQKKKKKQTCFFFSFTWYNVNLPNNKKIKLADLKIKIICIFSLFSSSASRLIALYCLTVTIGCLFMSRIQKWDNGTYEWRAGGRSLYHHTYIHWCACVYKGRTVWVIITIAATIITTHDCVYMWNFLHIHSTASIHWGGDNIKEMNIPKVH